MRNAGDWIGDICLLIIIMNATFFALSKPFEYPLGLYVLLSYLFISLQIVAYFILSPKLRREHFREYIERRDKNERANYI